MLLHEWLCIRFRIWFTWCTCHPDHDFMHVRQIICVMHAPPEIQVRHDMPVAHVMCLIGTTHHIIKVIRLLYEISLFMTKLCRIDLASCSVALPYLSQCSTLLAISPHHFVLCNITGTDAQLLHCGWTEIEIDRCRSVWGGEVGQYLSETRQWQRVVVYDNISQHH